MLCERRLGKDEAICAGARMIGSAYTVTCTDDAVKVMCIPVLNGQLTTSLKGDL